MGGHGSGGRPQPTALKILRGNPSKGRLNLEEPRHPPIELEVPARLTDPEAIAEWQRLAPMVHATGHVTKTDRALLIVYCRAWAEWTKVSREAEGQPQTVTHPKSGTEQINPIHTRVDRLEHNLIRAAGELGLTPSSRSRVVARPAPPGSKWAGVLK